MQIIPLSEVLKQIDYRDEQGKPDSFSIQFVSADISRNRGGKRVIAEKAWACAADYVPVQKKSNSESSTPESSTKFNHKRTTRNIMIKGVNHPVSVHIRLIELFNGQEVVY